LYLLRRLLPTSAPTPACAKSAPRQVQGLPPPRIASCLALQSIDTRIEGIRDMGVWLNLGGAASLSLGGIFALASAVRGEHARHLQSARVVDDLSGTARQQPSRKGACPTQPRTHRLPHGGAELRQLVSLAPLLIAVTGRVLAERTVKGDLTQEEGAMTRVRPPASRHARTARRRRAFVPAGPSARPTTRRASPARRLLCTSAASSEPAPSGSATARW
jgi:hypothetical protein